MIKAIVVDDELHCAHRLLELLKPYENIEIVGVCQTIASAQNMLQEYLVDLMFLDVQIHDQTGFDLLEQLDNVDFEVIFTTAYNYYAVQAFKFSAVDYLLKPVDIEDLKQAIEKVQLKINSNDFSAKMEVLLTNMQKPEKLKKIVIPTQDGFFFQNVSEIVRCQSEGNYTNIYTLASKCPILVSKTLKTFDEMLTECGFFRVHNSHLINLDFVAKYTKGKGGYVTMTDNSVIEVSTRRKDDFMKAIGL